MRLTIRSIDPYEKLANAIIYQAIEDYRKIWNIYDYKEKRDIIDFLYSDLRFLQRSAQIG